MTNPLHTEALQITNPPNVTWRNFIPARFVGTLPAGMLFSRPCGVVLRIAECETFAWPVGELSGHFDYSLTAPFATTYGLAGTVDWLTRAVALRESQPEEDSEPASYHGEISENGRVLILQAHFRDGNISDPLHFIHEETLAGLTPDKRS